MGKTTTFSYLRITQGLPNWPEGDALDLAHYGRILEFSGSGAKQLSRC